MDTKMTLETYKWFKLVFLLLINMSIAMLVAEYVLWEGGFELNLGSTRLF